MKAAGRALLLCLLAALAVAGTAAADIRADIAALAAFGDRSLGTAGCASAADLLADRFEALPGVEVGRQKFLAPVMTARDCSLTLADGRRVPVRPARFNAVTPPSTPPDGATGPVIYVGDGQLSDFDGLPVAGAIVLMDLDSGKNWLNAAGLGAAALVYLDRPGAASGAYQEKMELSPIDFPRFVLSPTEAKKAFPGLVPGRSGLLAEGATLASRAAWKRMEAENVYCLIPGSDPKLAEQLLVVEAFYDSSAQVFGLSPGADEASSAATLLDLAERLNKVRPKRSVLILATTGHAQALLGMREFVHAATAKSRALKRLKDDLAVRKSRAQSVTEALTGEDPLDLEEPAAALVHETLLNRVRDEVDNVTQELMRLRLKDDPASKAAAEELAARRLLLRRLTWKSSFKGLPPEERQALLDLIPSALEEMETLRKDVRAQLEEAKSDRGFRNVVRSKELAGVVSLHLSSHGTGLGAFNQGFFYELRPRVNLAPSFSEANEILADAWDRLKKEPGLSGLYVDSLRPNRSRPWQTWLPDEPALGGEVATMAGLLGLTLATVNDARSAWGTPSDVPADVDVGFLDRQARLAEGLARSLADHDGPLMTRAPREGFSVLDGRARFIRQGELFADRAAPGAVLMAFQGRTRLYAMSDAAGDFQFKGHAYTKLVQNKLIIEGYRFAPDSGRIVWAIDKQKTGKDAYRMKLMRPGMETDLVMFGCRQTTLFDLLTPRTFRYMTKVELIDGRRDAEPLHYWYSRIDTRSSTIASVFLEPDAPLKMTLSDTVLNRKMILTGADAENPNGRGYDLDLWKSVPATAFRAATDMWSLLAPRIENLETHGVVNERIRELQAAGLASLRKAEAAYGGKRYGEFLEKARDSWALATRVYLDVNQTQKDVLLGVLFYIALFVPFAYCLERLLFCFADIHRRILAFLAILAATIAVIYNVHPAFQLTYSPMVVILAFFILGLASMVALIIFLRFEQEMMALQRRAGMSKTTEIGKFKALAAAFVIGVSNLRRRKLRTALTCLTLVILTFTIMSFTAVKSLRSHTYVLFSEHAPYHGVFLKNFGWQSLPPEAEGIADNAFAGRAVLSPRAWYEPEDKTSAQLFPLEFRGRTDDARGLVGLAPDEPEATGLRRTLTAGRWFTPEDVNALLLPAPLAARLQAKPGDILRFWGMRFTLIGVFDPAAWEKAVDLDGEPVTPVVFPTESAQEMTEVEAEALESGEDVDMFQGRYSHIPAEATAVMPCSTLMTLGGELKALAAAPEGRAFAEEEIHGLSERFGLPIFNGREDGSYVHHATDAMSYSGVPNILVPLIISALIVLNTMITSVYERKREIAVYTSVGMAPTHVSFLFVAEALAFAVISAVLGYLLAQSAAWVFAGTALWSGMTANYSSMAGVAAMLLVIATVLVSVIYPSRVAGEIAIPDVNRSWKMPDAVDNQIHVVLPFLLKGQEQQCVGGYLLEYFEARRDASHGLFSSDDIDVGSQCLLFPGRKPGAPAAERHCLTLTTRVWLAPFDFGVKQRVTMTFCQAAEHPEFYEIRVAIQREAGEVGAWKRLNKNFLNDVRKQLLVWRSMDRDAQQSFRNNLDTGVFAARGMANPLPGSDRND